MDAKAPPSEIQEGRGERGSCPQRDSSSQVWELPAGTRTWGLELGSLFFVLLCFVQLYVVLVFHYCN